MIKCQCEIGPGIPDANPETIIVGRPLDGTKNPKVSIGTEHHWTCHIPIRCSCEDSQKPLMCLDDSDWDSTSSPHGAYSDLHTEPYHPSYSAILKPSG